MKIIDNRKYQYDNEGNIIRERTHEDIKFIDLFNSSVAHREWLEHLEELLLQTIWAIRDNHDNFDRLKKAEQTYVDQMENL